MSNLLCEVKLQNFRNELNYMFGVKLSLTLFKCRFLPFDLHNEIHLLLMKKLLQYCEPTDIIPFIRLKGTEPNEFPTEFGSSAYQSQRHLFDRLVRKRPSEKSDNINHVDAEIQFRAVEKIYINNLYPRGTLHSDCKPPSVSNNKQYFK